MDVETTGADSFINLERRACTHNIWKCFSWTRSTWSHYYPQQHDMLGDERRGGSASLCLTERIFSQCYLMEGEEHSTISRAPPHMEAITSNWALQLHRSRNESLKFLSRLLLSAGHAACPLTLILIIISFSAALPSWWLEALKVLLWVAREKKALVAQYICQALTFKYLCPPLQN